jgi:very-short-patch-repair endonuclease
MDARTGANFCRLNPFLAMARQIVQSIAAAVWALVDRQHGVIARRQLLELGMSASAIDHRIAGARLHRVFRGVYAVGRPQLSVVGRWMAAVLACGPNAVLSHLSAGALWGIGKPAGLVHVSVPLSERHSVRGLRVHRRRLRENDIARHLGIPVTGIVLTLVDLATTLSRDALEAAISEADKLDLIDPETLRLKLEEHRGRPGVAILRRTLDRHSFRPTDSWLERRFLPLVRRAGLPLPQTRRHKNGTRVDFYWPELGLVVETDGLRYHRTAAQQAKDALRMQRHAASGLFPLRFTYEQVRSEAAHVEATLRTVAARLRAGD